MLRVRTAGLLRLVSLEADEAAKFRRQEEVRQLKKQENTRKAAALRAKMAAKSPSKVPSSPIAQPKREIEAVRVSNVSFRYGNLDVLKNVDLSVPQGSRLVLFGRSGSGKSTLLKLIGRLYQPLEGGHVALFGQDVNDVVLSDVMSFMEQRNVIFEGSVGDNLKTGLGDAIDTDLSSDANVMEACLQATVWSDLQALSGDNALGYNVGFRGKRINEALAQRLCLARCLLRQKPLLLLDEPTSSQDAVTVTETVQMLQGLQVKRDDDPACPVTAIISSHQTEVAMHCTHAAVMLNGKVVEAGTKEGLMKRKGHFYRRIMASSGLTIDEKGKAHVTGERLRQIWLFANAPPLALTDLARVFVTRHCRNGDILFEPGEDADRMYLVVSGQVEELTVIATDAKYDQSSAGGAGAPDLGDEDALRVGR